MSNYEAISHFPKNENGYFFYNSISIIREIAKLVNEISCSELKKHISKRTLSAFGKLENDLLPFHDESLSKSTLKPIRDVNFHYNFPKIGTDSKLSALIGEIKSMNNLAVAVKPDKEDLLSIRYTYADWFRNEYINSHLNSEVVTQISTIAVEIVAFLDSLQADLMEDINAPTH